MEKNGRYQAVAMDSLNVFILDTQGGHLWLWGTCEQTGITLMYLGRLSIGKEPLDPIYQSQKDTK